MADFIKKLTEGIDRGIKAVSSKGWELVETTKLKGEIKDIQNLIERRFQALGKKVFEMINSETLNEEELKAECKEIATLFKKITELEEEIKKVELEALKKKYGTDVIMCFKCGSPNKSHAKFCEHCGSRIEAVLESKTCPICNASVKEDAKFCARCGGKIK